MVFGDDVGDTEAPMGGKHVRGFGEHGLASNPSPERLTYELTRGAIALELLETV